MGSPYIGRLDRTSTAFVLIDIQEAFRPHISSLDEVVANSNRLVKGATILRIPLLVTEQYPKGLGRTLPDIELPEGSEPMPKLSFSCVGCDDFRESLERSKVKSVVVFGIETHVCVLQTVLDLLELGYEVHVVADAVSSRTERNRELAFDRMRQSGAFIVSTEMVLFQLLVRAKSEGFKEISELVKYQ